MASREIQEAVGKALADTSVCWTNIELAGVFQSERASAIVDELCRQLDKLYANPEIDALAKEILENWPGHPHGDVGAAGSALEILRRARNADEESSDR